MNMLSSLFMEWKLCFWDLLLLEPIFNNKMRDSLMRGLSSIGSMVGGGKVGVGVRGPPIYIVALIKNNLREIYLHFLKESRDFFLALIHILVLVLDFFFKRREFGVVHMHRISNAVCKSSTFPLGELLPKWFSWLNNDRSMIQAIAITWNMISGGGMNLYWTEPVYVGNCQHTRSVHCTLAHLLARVSMFI